MSQTQRVTQLMQQDRVQLVLVGDAKIGRGTERDVATGSGAIWKYGDRQVAVFERIHGEANIAKTRIAERITRSSIRLSLIGHRVKIEGNHFAPSLQRAPEFVLPHLARRNPIESRK